MGEDSIANTEKNDRGLKRQLSDNISMISFGSKNKGSVATKTTKTATTIPEDETMDISGFRRLPSFEAFNRFGWVLVACQVTMGVLGAILSHFNGNGAIGGILSGLIGLWFVQLMWIVSLPSRCSTLSYHVGLVLLPLNKSVGFLVTPGPNGEATNWPEFLRRMAILTTMWCIPFWLAGETTGQVIRAMHGDTPRNNLLSRFLNGPNTIFDSERAKGVELDREGIKIRERCMLSTIKYAFIFPLVVFCTTNSIGGLVEAADYSEYASMTGDSFEIQTGQQFYLDYIRVANSNIFQGLVAVFTMVSLSALSCSGLDVGYVFSLSPVFSHDESSIVLTPPPPPILKKNIYIIEKQ